MAKWPVVNFTPLTTVADVRKQLEGLADDSIVPLHHLLRAAFKTDAEQYTVPLVPSSNIDKYLKGVYHDG
jgi:hypothetical protein